MNKRLKAKVKAKARVTAKPSPKPEPKAPAPLNLVARLTGLLSALKGMASERIKRREKFEIYQPWPGVVPKAETRKVKMAMDNAFGAMSSFAFAQGGWDSAGFLGYAFLAELAQITEYRRPAEILAEEMTRKWGKLISTSDKPAVKQKLAELEEDLKHYKVQKHVQKCFEMDNYFGIAHLYIDLGTKGEELKSPLVKKLKIDKGSLQAFRPVEPMWTYPNTYNAADPLSPHFYDPETWFVMGTEVHKTRMMRFVSREVPDMLKPAYLFGGLALTQMMEPYVNNWLQTRQSVSEITRNFSTPVLKTDMDQMTNVGGAQAVAIRAQIYNTMRSNQGLFVCDKDKEDFNIVSASLSSLSELQAQAIEQMAFPAASPLVKLFGVTPSGLNASSDGEIRTFYDSIAAKQEKVGTPNMQEIIEILQWNRYGEVDDGIKWEWSQLWELDEEKKATLRKTDAETDMIYLEGGILDPQAVVDKLTSDPDSRYSGLDLSLPEPEPGLEGEGGEEPPNGVTLTEAMGNPGPGKLTKEASREDRRGEGEEDPAQRRPGEEPRTARTAETARPARPGREAGERSER